MEKTRKQLVATVAAMLGDQYKVSISIRHFEECSNDIFYQERIILC